MRAYRPLALSIIAIVGVVIFAMVFANFMVAHDAKREKEEKRECVSQGGRVVTLGNREWCLIDGQKVEF